jgi:drug/metabolite transporter (DMT)-like permease
MRPGLEAFQPAALAVLGASLGYAVSNIATKKLVPVQHTIAILFWMNIMQAAMALIGTDPAFPFKLTAWQWLPAAGVALTGAVAHYCLTNALRVADAIVVIPLDFLRIPLIALIGWALYGERLDLLVFAGAGIIVTGIVWNLRAEMRK